MFATIFKVEEAFSATIFLRTPTYKPHILFEPKMLMVATYVHTSYNHIFIISRDRYKIIGLCKISHLLKQPCNSVYLKSARNALKIAEKMLYLG